MEKGFTQNLWTASHSPCPPDTAKNQTAFPHPRSQKEGVGLPIAQTVVILSLATAIVIDVVPGPYKGKETGESALPRQMLNPLLASDVVAFDRCYCSFMMIVQLLNRNADVCTRLHHGRHTDFRKGRRPGKYDHLIVWRMPSKPACNRSQPRYGAGSKPTRWRAPQPPTGSRSGLLSSCCERLRSITDTLNLQHLRSATAPADLSLT